MWRRRGGQARALGREDRVTPTFSLLCLTGTLDTAWRSQTCPRPRKEGTKNRLRDWEQAA